MLSASITSTTGFKVYSLSYSVAGGLDIELEVFASDTFAAEASSTLTTSASGERVLNPFPEIPLYGVRIPLGGRFSFLPDFRLGILFSLPVIPRYAAEINTPFEDLSARVEYTTGRRSITVRARGGLTAPTITVQSRVDAPAGFTADLSDGLIELFGPNPRNDLTLSLGLFFAPTLTLSAPGLEVSASTEVGLAADARFAFFPYLPSRPFNPEALVKEGICDQCHRAVLTAAFRGDGAIPVDAAVFGVDLDAPTLSGVAFDVPILDACGGSPIEPPSRIQVECRRADRKCCTASLFFCTVRPCIPIFFIQCPPRPSENCFCEEPGCDCPCYKYEGSGVPPGQ